MNYKTVTDLATHVLRSVLGVIDVSDPPSAEDKRDVSNMHELIHSELVDKGLAYWDGDEIPIVVFDQLCRLVGSRIAPSYGLPRDVQTELLAERELRKHVSKSASKLPVSGQYF